MGLFPVGSSSLLKLDLDFRASDFFPQQIQDRMNPSVLLSACSSFCHPRQKGASASAWPEGALLFVCLT